jgi:2-polyprenyl-3-methyl-5-hydroxy-6-metoxy-1,4-benzoquinol methylase
VSKVQDYPLGYSADEARRLSDQAAQVEQLTDDVLRRAGLAPGMRVLDVGSGVGDVSLLAAKIVGDRGAVLGIERAPSSVHTAKLRTASLGVRNVAFEQGDLAEFTTDEEFDAIIGRFVLMYVPDPAEALRKLTRQLRPGGIVAFQELDMSQIAQEPASELFVQARRWVFEAFAAGSTELDMGTKLYATVLRAGLPAPHMMAATPVVGGPTCGGYEHFVQALRSLLPMIERSRIADIEKIGIDTLAERLRQDAAANERVLFTSRIVAAWTRTC